jgi:peptide/nickel transport system permease protein
MKITISILVNLLSTVRDTWKVYKRNGLGVIGLYVLSFFILIAFTAPIFSPYPPLKTGAGEAFEPISYKHPMGTDDLGKDLLSGVLYGARATLAVSFFAVIIATFIGVGFGAYAGFYGGRIDDILMRITEIFMVIPQMFLALVFMAIFGSNIWNIIMVISLLSWPQMARLVRADFLSIKERPYADAARASGASNFYMIFREILPNAMPTVIVNMTLTQATAVLIESSLSFLGFGDPTVASWGLMLNNAQKYFRQSWTMVYFPGLSIFFTVLSLNLIGEGLNDVFNPRRKGKS